MVRKIGEKKGACVCGKRSVMFIRLFYFGGRLEAKLFPGAADAGTGENSTVIDAREAAREKSEGGAPGDENTSGGIALTRSSSSSGGGSVLLAALLCTLAAACLGATH